MPQEKTSLPLRLKPTNKKLPHGNFLSQRVPKTPENEMVLEAQMRLSALTHRTTLGKSAPKIWQPYLMWLWKATKKCVYGMVKKCLFFGEFRALAWHLDNLYSPKRLGFIKEG